MRIIVTKKNIYLIISLFCLLMNSACCYKIHQMYEGPLNDNYPLLFSNGMISIDNKPTNPALFRANYFRIEPGPHTFEVLNLNEKGSKSPFKVNFVAETGGYYELIWAQAPWIERTSPDKVFHVSQIPLVVNKSRFMREKSYKWENFRTGAPSSEILSTDHFEAETLDNHKTLCLYSGNVGNHDQTSNLISEEGVIIKKIEGRSNDGTKLIAQLEFNAVFAVTTSTLIFIEDKVAYQRFYSFQLLPGNYIVQVRYFSGSAYSKEALNIRFKPLPGHRYVVRANVTDTKSYNKDIWNPSIEDVTFK